MAMAGSERSERGLMAIAANSIASRDFLGYHANGQKGLEGAAKRRLKHPGSRYKKAQLNAVLFSFIYPKSST